MTAGMWLAVAAAWSAPATTLNHRVEVTVGADRWITTAVTWVVRIDDPAACAAGVVGPPGLTGARDGQAVVLDDLLTLPADIQAGTTLTLQQTTVDQRRSDQVLGAPGLPVEAMTVLLRAPPDAPLSIWADPTASHSWSTRGGRVVSLAWSGIPEGTDAQLVWSLDAEWQAAARPTSDAVGRQLVGREALGRTLAAEVNAISIAEAVSRVWEAVDVAPGNAGSWTRNRDVAAILQGGEATAAERGLVLVSLLRLAGFDARAAWFRPPGARGTFPPTVPAALLLHRPLVVVYRGDKPPVYLDPLAPIASGDAPPADLWGGVLWELGDLPRPFGRATQGTGVVQVESRAQLDREGRVVWTAQVVTRGTATERIRALLDPLPAADRQTAIARLVREARPDLVGLTVDISGVERADRPLQIRIDARESTGQAFPGGLRTSLPPLLGPALASWLPPMVEVREVTTIAPPSDLLLEGWSSPPGASVADALVTRHLDTTGGRLVVTATFERPYPVSTPVRDAHADLVLTAQGKRGPDLLFFSLDPKARGSAIADPASPLNGAERAWFAALPAWHDGRLPKGDKILTNARLREPLDALLAALLQWRPDDGLAWDALLRTGSSQPAERLAIAQAMLRAGQRGRALTLAHALATEGTDPAVRLEAIHLVLEAQRPGDPTGRAPADWLADVAQLGGGDDPRFALARARVERSAGQLDLARARLAPLVATDPVAALLLAEIEAEAGGARDAVREAAETGIRLRADDPAVHTSAAAAFGATGRLDEAAAHAWIGARLATDDPTRWADARDRALAAGDLASALAAARAASDLAPTDAVAAEALLVLARLQPDPEAEALAWRRRGGRDQLGQGLLAADLAPTLAALLPLVPPTHLLALLTAREAEVVAEPKWLAIRAQLHLDAGQLDAAARDGLLLWSRYDRPDGMALAFAATAGRGESAPRIAALDRAATRDTTARQTRLEYRLLTGGDPGLDARALGGTRGGAVLDADRAPGWPTDRPTPTEATPTGFRPNPWLSVPGVQAFSDPEASVALLRIAGPLDALPPPLASLYTPDPRPESTRTDAGGRTTRVVRWTGGFLPVYAAIRTDDDRTRVGIGFSVEAAVRALARDTGEGPPG